MAVSTLSDLRSRLDVERYDSDPGKLLSEYTSDDNRLMQLASAQGRQSANRRGMLNSSMSAGASMDAMAKTALPLAQQRSEQLEARNTREEAGLMQTNLQEQQFGFESQMSAQDAAQRSELLGQEFGQQQQLSAQEADQERELQDRRIGSEMELAQLDADTRENLMAMEEGMRTRLAGLETDREQYQDASQMITTFTEQYQSSMRSILSNPDMAAEDRNSLLENAGTLLNLQTDMVRELYDVEISWSGDNFSPTAQQPETGGTGQAAAQPEAGGTREEQLGR